MLKVSLPLIQTQSLLFFPMGFCKMSLGTPLLLVWGGGPCITHISPPLCGKKAEESEDTNGQIKDNEDGSPGEGRNMQCYGWMVAVNKVRKQHKLQITKMQFLTWCTGNVNLL